MPRRTRLLARVAAGVVPVAFVVAGCASEREATSAPPEIEVAGSVDPAPPTSANTIVDVDHVAMVGDSITVGSLVELEEAFGAIGFPDAEINAQSGRKIVRNDGISSGLEAVAEVLADGEEPDLWVVALGTNDVANYLAEQYPTVIEELLAAIPDDAPIVWVDTYLDGYQAEAAVFDATLRQVLSERGNASVVDWQTIAAEDGVLTDGVHPSGFGRVEFARRVIDAVVRWTS